MGNIRNKNIKVEIEKIFLEFKNEIKDKNFQELKEFLNQYYEFKTKKNRNEICGGLIKYLKFVKKLF